MPSVIRLRLLAATFLSIVVFHSTAPAQVLTNWTFPSGFNATNPLATNGTGTASLLGTTGGSTSGLNTDGTTAWTTIGYAAQGTESGQRGVRFNTSTAGASDLIIRMDQRNSSIASRFTRLEYTTDGTTFTSAGLLNGGVLSNEVGNKFFSNRGFDFSGISGVASANFGFRVVAIFAPNTSEYQAASTGSTYSTTGEIRFDNVTVTQANRWIGGTGTDIATAANYANNSAPTSTSTLLFSGTSNTTVSVGTAATYAQLYFGANAGSHTISGQALTLPAGIVNDSAVNQTISAPVIFGDDTASGRTIYANTAGGRVSLNGNITIGTANINGTSDNGQLMIAGPGDVALNGLISFGGTPSQDMLMRKSGSGTVFFNNASNPLSPAFPQNSRIDAGTLAGTGVAPGAWSIGTGARIQAGDGSGVGQTLTIGTNLLVGQAPGATINWRVTAGNGGTSVDTSLNGSSRIAVTGTINESTNTTGRIVFELLDDGSLDTTGSTTYTRRLGTYGTAGANFNEGTFTQADTTQYDVVGIGFSINSWTLTVNGGVIDLVFTPVPEPGTVLGIAVAGLGAIGYLRRRLKGRSEAALVAA